MAEAAFFCIVGVGFFMTHNSVQAEVAEIDPEARSSCFAMHSAFFYLGQFAGPIVWTLAIGALGPRGALMLMGVAMALAGLAASVAFRRCRRSSPVNFKAAQITRNACRKSAVR